MAELMMEMNRRVSLLLLSSQQEVMEGWLNAMNKMKAR